MSRPTLLHLQTSGLIAAAGGDPWAVDDSLRTGSPTQIDFLAGAFHQAGQSTEQAETVFQSARSRFAQYRHEDGTQPINAGAEVARVRDGLHASREQLGRIAADLETIAAALAEAHRTTAADIAKLNTNLELYDAQIGEYLAAEHDCVSFDHQIRQLGDRAVADTTGTLHNVTGTRSAYAARLDRALTNLRVNDRYDPDTVLDRYDADDGLTGGDGGMGGVPGPAPAADPDEQAVLAHPPEDPALFRDFWDRLTPAQKDRLYDHDHGIGNHPGMPCDPDLDHLGYDHYNRRHLTDALGDAQAAADRAAALRDQHPDWADGTAVPRPNTPGAIFADRVAYEKWLQEYNSARDTARYLPDLQAVNRVVQVSSDRRLMLLDTETGTQARAAVAVGDPDRADHVSVTTPGLNTTVHGAVEGMANEAMHLRDEALRQLQLAPGHDADTVATVAWIGYDPPQVPGPHDVRASAGGAWDVSHDAVARAGAHDLARFYDGIQASHRGGPADLTAIGHSYGSLTTGLALQEPGGSARLDEGEPTLGPPHQPGGSARLDEGEPTLGPPHQPSGSARLDEGEPTLGPPHQPSNLRVSHAIFYGSPGIEATTAAQLHLQPEQVFTMETPDDPIQRVYDVPPIARLVAPLLPAPLGGVATTLLAAADATGAGDFGPNPATNPGFTHLATGAATVPDGHGGTLELQDAHGHSDYPRFPDAGGLRTTNYNIAAVIAGLGDMAIRQR